MMRSRRSQLRLPLIASTSAFRAWSGGVALAIAVICLPFATAFLPLPMPFASAFYLVPVGFAALASYSLTVRPRAFAASGALLGVAPFFAWGVIDGLQRCARFNRAPSGGCEADPSSQLLVTAIVYVAALLATGAAVWSSTRSARS
jgi:hypothetical protein